MLNFRFHIVSLVAVFLALAIGIIMGSTVIDRALVDTLEDQQQSLRGDLDSIREENAALRRELDELREGGDRLASEGGARLLAATLADVPVLVVAVRGVEASVLDDLGELLGVAGVDDQGTLWLTERFALPDQEAVTDLADALGLEPSTPPALLRQTAIDRIAGTVGSAVAPEDETAADDEAAVDPESPGGEEPSGAGEGSDAPDAPDAAEESSEPAGAGALGLLVSLRDAGFVDYDAPEGGDDDIEELAAPGTRLVLVSGAGAGQANQDVAEPLARSLVDPVEGGAPAVPVLAAEALLLADDADGGPEPASFVGLLRQGEVADRLSTVDNLDTFAGRLAAVVALQDLGDGRRGHYGVGPGAQRLVPAPEG